MSASRATRLGRDDWVREATAVLAEAGFHAVAVEPIAARLGVTKGSFYSHFGSREELVDAVLERWRATDTTDVLAALSEIEDPRERLAAYLDLGFGRDEWGRVFAALCASAAEPEVAATMDKVREARLAMFADALRGVGMSSTEAADRATLIYAAYVGFWRLVAADPDWAYNGAAKRRRFAGHLAATLLPSVPS